MWRKTMSLISKVIIKSFELATIAQVLSSTDFKMRAKQAGVFDLIDKELGTLQYLLEHVKTTGGLEASIYHKIGYDHEKLLTNILNIIFTDATTTHNIGGPLYELLNFLLKSLEDKTPKVSAA